VRRAVRLETPRKDGTTLRQHLSQAEFATGLQIIEEPDPPHDGLHLWSWFWELDGARGEGMSGPLAISFSDIDAWARLTRSNPEPWEVQALKKMDAARLDETAKTMK